MQLGVFVSYRRDDTGWAARALSDALVGLLGRPAVFLDNSSIELGAVFSRALEDAVRRSTVFVALIGPDWDRPPLVERLGDPADWVRREILLAHEHGVRIAPVLVDRPAPPTTDALPPALRFLAGVQSATIRQSEPADVPLVASRIVGLLPTGGCVPAPVDQRGVEATRPALDRLLRFLLPPAQQWSGNRDRLLDLALAVLGRADRLVFLAPARIHDGPRGSATVFVTATDLLVVEVGEDLRIRGEIRLPLGLVRRVEVVPTLPLFADAIVHTSAGDEVRLQGLFRDQARQLADELRG